MPFIPLLRALLSLAGLVLIASVAWLLWTWWSGELVVYDPGLTIRVREDWRLWTALALVAFSALGRVPMLLLIAKPDTDPTRAMRARGEMVASPTGAELYVEVDGAAEGPVVIANHGWGLDSTIWRYLKRDLAEARTLAPNQLITWDLAGVGRSKAPEDGRITLENFAADLETLIVRVAPRPVILIGHSIGGMTIQTLVRDAPALVRDRVAGIVLVNTTYTNPLKTMILSGLAQALRKPVLEPMFRLTILLKPLAWLSAWQSYFNGMSHLANRLQFAGSVTYSQLDHTTLLGTRNSPAVLAKGNLAMFDWDATGAMAGFTGPVLVIGGEQDLVTRLEAGEAIRAQSSTGELQRVSNANHMGFLERSHHYNALIGAFIVANGGVVRPPIPASLAQ
ncbi:alpha/beta hydrolase [Brevundimonas sp.]|uniref:alpha/beta fold hydrolase n=1 Tax=Brevundimonas sp. TaxID=1871086 RepID=UPI00286C757C|nr:alpha/beta hydrolase [Brevundimonas sp.]